MYSKACSAEALHAADAQGEHTVHCQVSCQSVAGREPGFKKQNQDSCFAFDKFASRHQALFGTFDGHGPNGMLNRTSQQCMSVINHLMCCARSAVHCALLAQEKNRVNRQQGEGQQAFCARMMICAGLTGHFVSSHIKQHLPIALLARLNAGTTPAEGLQHGEQKPAFLQAQA